MQVSVWVLVIANSRPLHDWSPGTRAHGEVTGKLVSELLSMQPLWEVRGDPLCGLNLAPHSTPFMSPISKYWGAWGGRLTCLRADHLAPLMESLLLGGGGFVSIFRGNSTLKILGMDPVYFFPEPPCYPSYSLAPSRSMTSQARP